MPLRISAAVLLLLVGCSSPRHQVQSQQPGAVAPATSASPSPAEATTTPPPYRYVGPHFDTPQASMTYLTTVYNRFDLAALRKVTTPTARDELVAMHGRGVSDLRLRRCTRLPRGDYRCTFSHGFAPRVASHPPPGNAEFIAGPADGPGWYMTVFESCN
jgi:hypothetical protein